MELLNLIPLLLLFPGSLLVTLFLINYLISKLRGRGR